MLLAATAALWAKCKRGLEPALAQLDGLIGSLMLMTQVLMRVRCMTGGGCMLLMLIDIEGWRHGIVLHKKNPD